jgi:DNA-binding SARP family transcriptional activator/tetratricopeptide (TPR) repeat protein
MDQRPAGSLRAIRKVRVKRSLASTRNGLSPADTLFGTLGRAVVAVQFRVLGPLEVRARDGRPVHLGAAKHRILLSVLLLSANRPVSADRLVEALWSTRPPRSAPSALRTYASALRGALQLRAEGTPALVGLHGGYQIRIDPAELDLLVFEELATEGQKVLADGDALAAVDRLQRALALWRGDPLEDVPLDSVLEPELARLTEIRLTTLEASIEARLALGQHATLVPELGALVTAHPLRERLRAMLMLALYRCGRQADALAAFRQLRTDLVEELGIEPSPQVTELHAQILSASPELTAPARPAPVPVPRQLPPDVSGFTGRRTELARLTDLLRPAGAVPVCALDGIAGIGKSALAIHAAHRVADRFPDGQLYADLRGASADRSPVTPNAILGRFLRALGVTGADAGSVEEAAATFRGATADRKLLIVLDNARDAAQVKPLLPAGPGCAVLVTSRQVLATLDGATHVHLDVLSATEAVALLGRGDRAATATIARLCGYLPLALRIVGARLAARPTWPVQALAERLSDAQRRLDELQLGDLGVRASFQVSLQELATSDDPLDRLAAEAFPQVAVPDGADVSLGLAASLLDRPVDATERALERLVDAGLLDSPAPRRYRLHDLLRLYGRERLADPVAVLVRGLRWYDAAAREAAAALRPADRQAASDAAAILDRLETERVNLLAAVHQAADTPGVPAELATSLAHALFGFFDIRGYRHEWILVSRTALAVARRSGDPAAEAYAHRDLGVAYERLGRYDEALESLDAGLTIFRRIGDLSGQARSLNSIGVIHHRQGRYPKALRRHQEALAIHRRLGDRNGAARSLNNLGVSYQRQARFARAQECYQECLALFQELGDRRIEAAILTNLGVVHERQGQYEAALACQEESLSVFRARGDLDGQATSLNNLGRVYRALGRHRDALARHREAFAICVYLGERLTQAECLREIGSARHALGQPRRAEAYWRQALAIFEELDVPDAEEVKALLGGELR